MKYNFAQRRRCLGCDYNWKVLHISQPLHLGVSIIKPRVHKWHFAILGSTKLSFDCTFQPLLQYQSNPQEVPRSHSGFSLKM